MAAHAIERRIALLRRFEPAQLVKHDIVLLAGGIEFCLQVTNRRREIIAAPG